MEGKRLYCIRGAACAENSKESIRAAVRKLFDGICDGNAFAAEDIVSVQFTMTRDLDTLNAATALRTCGTRLDVSAVPLFCAQEPEIIGMMPCVIRTMVTAYMPEGSKLRNVYVNGAEVLRPDLAGLRPKQAEAQ
ncbi:MAG: chorismate mutase [Treponema sp.]|nr:chorismate mutase [Treponema sp.]